MKKLLIILCVTFLVPSLGRAAFNLKVDPKICEGKKTAAEINDCWKAASLASNDANYCKKLKDAKLRADCVDKLLTKTGDAKVCAAHQTANLQKDCKNKAAKNKDMKTKPLDICRSYKGGNYVDCATNAAAAMSEIGYCDTIFNEIFRQNCYAKFVGLDFYNNVCDKIKDAAVKDNCASNEAIAKGNADACLKLKDKMRCVASVAQKANKPELCDKLSDKNQIDRCLIILAKKETDCQKMKTNTSKFLCFEQFGSKLLNATLCEQVVTEKIISSDRCYASAAYTNKDKSLCDKINSVESKNMCNQAVESNK